MQKLQNRAAKIVTNRRYYASAGALVEMVNWPNISQII